MKVKEIVSLALVFLDKEDLLDFKPFGEEEVIPELEGKEIDHLLKCFNLVYNEVATAYLPLLKEEKVVFKNGVLPFDGLSKSLIEVKKLFSNGKNIKYKIFEDGIHANVKEAVITYSYLPDELGFESDVFLFGGKLPYRVLAYGLCFEYSVLAGLFDDANLWEGRYKDGLKLACSKKSDIVIPARRWL